jgi:hypothetical protein
MQNIFADVNYRYDFPFIGEGAADITTSTHWLNVYCAIAFWIVSVITVLSGLIYAKDGWYLIKTK